MLFDEIKVLDNIYFSRETWNSLTLEEQLEALRQAVAVQRLLEETADERYFD